MPENKGHNGGFDPFRDSHGRWASAASTSAARGADLQRRLPGGETRLSSPPPGEYVEWAAGSVRVVTVKGASPRYEVYDGGTLVHTIRATRAWRQELDQARQFARQHHASTTPPAPPKPEAAPPPPPPAKPTSASQAAPVAWKPVMTPEEADRWAANSAIKEDVFHSMKAENLFNIERLKKNGFTVYDNPHQRPGAKPIWGEGIYLAKDMGTRRMYEEWMERGKTLTLRVNVKRPFTMKVGYDRQPSVTKYIQDPKLRARFDELEKEFYEPYRRRAANGGLGRNEIPSDRGDYHAFAKLVKELGYDALIIDGHGIPTGGQQVIVFDPKNVVVTGVSDTFEHEPWEPPDGLLMY